MITLNKLIFDIKNLLRGGLVSDDEPISDRQIAFWINSARAVLIRQQIDKGQTLSDNIIQPITIAVEQIPIITGIETDCMIVRTVNRIPKPLESRQGDMILSISTGAYGVIPFTVLPNSVMPFSDHNPFGKKVPKAFLENGYIIIKNIPQIDNIEIEGVWENPEEISEYTTNGVVCFDADGKYPISEHMIDPLKRLIIDTNFRTIINPISDIVNNAQPDLQINKQ